MQGQRVAGEGQMWVSAARGYPRLAVAVQWWEGVLALECPRLDVSVAVHWWEGVLRWVESCSSCQSTPRVCCRAARTLSHCTCHLS